MKATEVVSKLQALIDQHGDKDVTVPDWEYGGTIAVLVVEPLMLTSGTIEFVVAEQPGFEFN